MQGQHHRSRSGTPDWTHEFSRHLNQQNQSSPSLKSGSPSSASYGLSRQHPQAFQQQAGWAGPAYPVQDPLTWQHHAQLEYSLNDTRQSQQDTQLTHAFEDAQWQQAFESQVSQNITQQDRSASPPLQGVERTPQTDEALAQTARELLDSVSDDINPKFAQSQFLGLMRKFRDYETVIDGNALVEQEAGQRPAAIDKGKGRAVDNLPHPSTRTHRMHENFNNMIDDDKYRQQYSQAQEDQDRQLQESTIQSYADMNEIWDAEYAAREEEQADREKSDVPLLNRQFQGDGGLVDDDEEIVFGEDSDGRFDMRNIIGGPTEGRLSPNRISRSRQGPDQRQDWNILQDEWDAFEATATGIRPVSRSQDAQSDARSDALAKHLQDRRRAAAAVEHALHHSVSELEAGAQMEPTRPEAWLALGVKQQENEREDMAIRALNHALELDPTLCEAHLALAVSYANESNRILSYDSIYQWVSNRLEYADTLTNFRSLQGRYEEQMSQMEKHAFLTSALINIAQISNQNNPSNIDADLQIALGVLFNSSEDYLKARDCFQAALAARPSNHILYNRVGATFANSGQPEQAMEYYTEALRVQPSYARARFNLAISCITMSAHREWSLFFVYIFELTHDLRSDEAASHILTALDIQENEHANLTKMVGDADAGRMHDTTGPMSTSLWATLETCCSL